MLGATTANAFLYSAVGGWIAGVGNFMQGVWAEKFGRRKVQAWYVVFQVLGLILLGLAGSLWSVVVAFIVYNYAAGNFTLGKLYVTEQYPTQLRSTGAAVGETSTRFLCGVVLAFFIPSLMSAWGAAVLFTVLGVVMLLLISPMLLWGRETANLSIDVAGSDLKA